MYLPHSPPVYIIHYNTRTPTAPQCTLSTVHVPPQRQDRYKAVQSLVDHLDARVKESWETKQGILGTLSKCVAVAADSSLGESPW